MTATEWLFLQLYERFEMKGDGREMDKVLEQAKAMEKERDKKIALHFMMLGIKNKGDFSKINFYK